MHSFHHRSALVQCFEESVIADICGCVAYIDNFPYLLNSYGN